MSYPCIPGINRGAKVDSTWLSEKYSHKKISRLSCTVAYCVNFPTKITLQTDGNKLSYKVTALLKTDYLYYSNIINKIDYIYFYCITYLIYNICVASTCRIQICFLKTKLLYINSVSVFMSI